MVPVRSRSVGGCWLSAHGLTQPRIRRAHSVCGRHGCSVHNDIRSVLRVYTVRITERERERERDAQHDSKRKNRLTYLLPVATKVELVPFPRCFYGDAPTSRFYGERIALNGALLWPTVKYSLLLCLDIHQHAKKLMDVHDLTCT